MALNKSEYCCLHPLSRKNEFYLPPLSQRSRIDQLRDILLRMEMFSRNLNQELAKNGQRDPNEVIHATIGIRFQQHRATTAGFTILYPFTPDEIKKMQDPLIKDAPEHFDYAPLKS